ncbi:MAG: hypothetical protein ABIK62_08090, partial [candidate division WOR-3 bacterium]
MLERLRELEQREQERTKRYHGLAAAWHIWRVDYEIAFLLLLVAVGSSLLMLGANLGGRFATDDAYVTLSVARNIARSGRCTFDGTGTTTCGPASPPQVLLV